MKKLILYTVILGILTFKGYGYDAELRAMGKLRKACSQWGNPKQPPNRVDTTERLAELRKVMKDEIKLKTKPIDAYLVTSDDQHQSEYVAAYDRRRQYISGFSGSYGDAIVTYNEAALWTDGRYHLQADDELNCDWLLMRAGEKDVPSKSEWLKMNLKSNNRIGADPKLVPASVWEHLKEQLNEASIELVEIDQNLIDLVWKEHEDTILNKTIFVLDTKYAGKTWYDKVADVRNIIRKEDADAMIITALDEIAWLLNIRGRDIPYNPMVSSYVILSERNIHFFVDQSKLTLDVSNHLNINKSIENSVISFQYDRIWTELPTLTQNWKQILVPTYCVFSQGVSQRIYSIIPKRKRKLIQSPIIFLKARKNPVEIENMKIAHIRDAAAMCMFFSYFEQKIELGHVWNEIEIANELDSFRFEQINSLGNSFTTIAGFGANGAKPHYEPTNSTNVEIKEDSTLVLDSGGQYYEGTTDVTRTIHLGTPKPEQINAYTRVLMGLIQFSTLTFPSDMDMAMTDVMARAPLWEAGLDYSHGSSHGVGSFLGVHESPVNIHYRKEAYLPLEQGYFISIEPGFYSESYFGVRLENVLEVVNKPWLKHMSGKTFLGFKDVTLVPFQPKLINASLLNTHHIRWLNDYNSKIREHVGKELKMKGNVEAFYWMMKQTEYIPNNGNILQCQTCLHFLAYVIFIRIIL